MINIHLWEHKINGAPAGHEQHAERLSLYLQQGTLWGRPLFFSLSGHWGTALLRTPWQDTSTHPWLWWRHENLDTNKEHSVCKRVSGHNWYIQAISKGTEAQFMYLFIFYFYKTIAALHWHNKMLHTSVAMSHQQCWDGWFPSGASPPHSGASGKRSSVWLHIYCWSSWQPKERHSAFPFPS